MNSADSVQLKPSESSGIQLKPAETDRNWKTKTEFLGNWELVLTWCPTKCSVTYFICQVFTSSEFTEWTTGQIMSGVHQTTWIDQCGPVNWFNLIQFDATPPISMAWIVTYRKLSSANWPSKLHIPNRLNFKLFGFQTLEAKRRCSCHW